MTTTRSPLVALAMKMIKPSCSRSEGYFNKRRVPNARLEPQSNRGFTLIEVLIALIFFALVGVVLQQVTASTVGQYHTVRLKMFGSWLAENKLAELRLSEQLPKAREYKEDIEFADADWQLVSKVSTTENPDINRVEVESYHIDPDSGEKSKTITLTGFVGKY